MGARGNNKIQRQESWLRVKAEKGKAQIAARRERRREEDKNPALRAERLAKNKPKTLDDKRVWPVSEDDWARRKRRKVAEEKEKEEEKTEEAEDDGDDDKNDNENDKSGKDGDDDDMNSLLGSDSDDDDDDDDDDDAEAGDGDSKKEKKKAAAAKAKEAAEADEAAKRAAFEDAMAARYADLLPAPLSADEPAPKLLITTSRHATIHRFAETLVDLFPNSTYIPRSGHRFVAHEYSVREIAAYAHNRGYSALLLLNEDQKRPTGLDVALLPQGPMLHFSVQTWIDAKRLPNHGRSTGHCPEVLLNNFVTPLGRLVGGVLGRLFPHAPELVGRQVVTLHNQRDFVFVRRHRYAMRDKRATERSVTGADGQPLAGVEDVRVALQEIGPRITLKLRRVDRGLQRRSGQAFEWTGRMDKKRTMWQL